MTDLTTGAAYLRSFWDMITSSIEHMPFAPGDYAAYATSIVGKPFALVNAGFSLELALPPLESQISKEQQPAVPGASGADTLFSYKFPVKVGDKERLFDGVVGYFDTQNTSTLSTNFDSLHTYFTADGNPEPGDPRLGIEPSNFELLSPYYIDPDPSSLIGSYRAAHAARLKVKTMLIDPYTSLHLYTPILPIKSFKLSSWTVQNALQKMSKFSLLDSDVALTVTPGAFFRVGPILHTTNLPTEYDPAKAVSAETWARKQQEFSAGRDAPPISLPIGGGKKGQWNWLQPYVTDEATGKRQYNALDVGEEGRFESVVLWNEWLMLADGRMRLDPGPYTLVEGFLQLMQPLKAEDLQ
jgi:hypothetical protein